MLIPERINMSNFDLFLKRFTVGDVICDMHYGLGQLEDIIPGFKLLSHHKIRCDKSTEAVQAILDGCERYNTMSVSYCNKSLVLVSDSSIGFYAVYSYDGRYFGSICFNIDS
jgi:hypothetical protein